MAVPGASSSEPARWETPNLAGGLSLVFDCYATNGSAHVVRLLEILKAGSTHRLGAGERRIYVRVCL